MSEVVRSRLGRQSSLFDELGEYGVDAARLHRLADAVGKHEAAIVPIATEQEAAPSLACVVLVQRGNDLVDQFDGAARASGLERNGRERLARYALDCAGSR